MTFDERLAKFMSEFGDSYGRRFLTSIRVLLKTFYQYGRVDGLDSAMDYEDA